MIQEALGPDPIPVWWRRLHSSYSYEEHVSRTLLTDEPVRRWTVQHAKEKVTAVYEASCGHQPSRLRVRFEQRPGIFPPNVYLIVVIAL